MAVEKDEKRRGRVILLLKLLLEEEMEGSEVGLRGVRLSLRDMAVVKGIETRVAILNMPMPMPESGTGGTDIIILILILILIRIGIGMVVGGESS